MGPLKTIGQSTIPPDIYLHMANNMSRDCSEHSQAKERKDRRERGDRGRGDRGRGDRGRGDRGRGDRGRGDRGRGDRGRNKKKCDVLDFSSRVDNVINGLQSKVPCHKLNDGLSASLCSSHTQP